MRPRRPEPNDGWDLATGARGVRPEHGLYSVGARHVNVAHRLVKNTPRVAPFPVASRTNEVAGTAGTIAETRRRRHVPWSAINGPIIADTSRGLQSVHTADTSRGLQSVNTASQTRPVVC